MSTQLAKKTISSKPKKKVGEKRVVNKARSKRSLALLQNPIIVKCKKTLKKYYGKRLKGVMLYGSMARKEATPTSDIDLLVLLVAPLDYFAELRQIVDVLYPLQLESEHLISAKPVLVSDFESGTISLYRNAKMEGVLVCDLLTHLTQLCSKAGCTRRIFQSSSQGHSPCESVLLRKVS